MTQIGPKLKIVADFECSGEGGACFAWFQSLDYGFGQDMKVVGIPVVPLSSPASDIIFAALQQEEDYWKFMNETKDSRNLEPDDLTGVIMSALLTKQYL